MKLLGEWNCEDNTTLTTGLLTPSYLRGELTYNLINFITMISYLIVLMSADQIKIRIFTVVIIILQTLTGKEIEIDIEPTDRVERIKERVEEKEGIPPPQQRLIFSGKQMYVTSNG